MKARLSKLALEILNDEHARHQLNNGSNIIRLQDGRVFKVESRYKRRHNNEYES